MLYLSYKWNFIFTLLFEPLNYVQFLTFFIKRCSNFKLFYQEILNFKDNFKRNGYHCNFIDVCNKRVLNNIPIDKQLYALAPRKELVCVLPFIGKKSLQVRSKLAKSVHNNLTFCRLKVVFQSPCKLPTLFRFKETLKKLKSFVIILFIVIRVAAAMLLIMIKLTDTFLQELQNMGVFQI